MTPIIISVTEEDIANGEAKDADSCPVARAMVRSGLGSDGEVVAGINKIYWGHRNCVPTPKGVKAFMVSFDHGEKVTPFTFELRLRSDSAGAVVLQGKFARASCTRTQRPIGFASAAKRGTRYIGNHGREPTLNAPCRSASASTK